MQRHQSNPFLAGWQPDEPMPASGNRPAIARIFPADDDEVDLSSIRRRHSVQPKSEFTGNRKNSNSSSNNNSNNNNKNDNDNNNELHDQARRSSAENHSVCIAKMRAEFESAIASANQEQPTNVIGTTASTNLAERVEIDKGDDAEIGQPSFDPFATIVDDDTSIRWSNSTSGPRHSHTNQKDSIADVADVDTYDGSAGTGATDDDDDVVISKRQTTKFSSTHGDYDEQDADEHHVNTTEDAINSLLASAADLNINVDDNNNRKDTDSIRPYDKAAIYKYVYDNDEKRMVKDKDQFVFESNKASSQMTRFDNETAESETAAAPSVTTGDDFYGPYDEHREDHEEDQDLSGNVLGVERPVSFFDPFETVVDKDALTSPGERSSPGISAHAIGGNDIDQELTDMADGESIVEAVEFSATSMHEVTNNNRNNHDDNDNDKHDSMDRLDLGEHDRDFEASGSLTDDNVECFRALSPSPRVSPSVSSGAINAPDEDADGVDDACTDNNIDDALEFPAPPPELAAAVVDDDNHDDGHETNVNTSAANDTHETQEQNATPRNDAPHTHTAIDEVPPTPAPTPMHALPRSTSMLARPSGGADKMPQNAQVVRLAEPLNAANKARVLSPRHHRRRKDSFKEDSSEEDNDERASGREGAHDDGDNNDDDDDEEDEKIRIVIRDASPSVLSLSRGAVQVPLLPPPPSKSSMQRQAREKSYVVEDATSSGASHPAGNGAESGGQKKKMKQDSQDADAEFERYFGATRAAETTPAHQAKQAKHHVSSKRIAKDHDDDGSDDDDSQHDDGEFVIRQQKGAADDDEDSGPDTPLFDTDTSYVLEEFPQLTMDVTWTMMLRWPPKKKLTSQRFWKKVYVRLVDQPLAEPQVANSNNNNNIQKPQSQIAHVLKILESVDEPNKCLRDIPIEATYSVSDINSQQFDQYGKIFTIKLQYVFYRERVGVRPGQLARFMHTGHIGSSTTSGGHGVGPTSFGDIKRLGAPLEHAPQVSQIIKLGCHSYADIVQFKHCLEDILFRMPIARATPPPNGGASTGSVPSPLGATPIAYKAEEIQMGVRDEIYLEQNQVGTIIKQLARVRLFFLSFLNGTPTVEVGVNDVHRQGREVVGRHDILPVMTEEWIRLEACELHCTVDKAEFENPDSRIIRLVPPDATFLELMRFRVRPPRNRELPLQVSAHMSVTRSLVTIGCDVIVPGCISRKHGQIPCEDIAIRVHIPECWIYFFRTEKHFRYGSKKSTNRRPGKVKGIERFLGGGNQTADLNDASQLIEVTSGQAKYEHHYNAIVWRAARWPKESQSAYLQNSMKIHLPLSESFDKMPDSYYEYVHCEFTMPATTVSHTTLRSISVSPQSETPPEKYVKYMAKYEYKIKMRLSVNVNDGSSGAALPEASPIVFMKPAGDASSSVVGQPAAATGKATPDDELDSDDAEPAYSDASD